MKMVFWIVLPAILVIISVYAWVTLDRIFLEQRDVPVPLNTEIAPDPYVEAVREKLLKRSRVGVAKYGTNLEREDLSVRDWLVHAQEECMDLANYLEVLIQKYDRGEIRER